MESAASETVVLDVRRSEKDTNDLYEAAVEGDVAILSALLQRDALILNEVSLTSFSETPLHIASLFGHVAFAGALVERKPMLAVELDSFARSPLHLASAEGHVDVVKLLLDRAPRACMLVDRDDRIPLHLAAIRGRVEVLEELIRACPGSTQVTLNGDSVAHLCVKYCRLGALMLLLGNDSDHQLLNSRDGEGNNVLHLAVMLNHFKVVKYLASLEGIKERANELNQDGHTSLDVFDRGQNKDFNSFRIQQVLLRIGASRARDLNPSLPPPTPSSPTPANVSPVENTTSSRPRPSAFPFTAANVNVGEMMAAPTLAGANHLQKMWGRLLKKWNELHELFGSYPGWITDAHGNLMIVATVIAGMCFQAVMNPPGGVWQQDTTSGATCDTEHVCLAGTPVLAYGDAQDEYYDYIDSVAMAFVLSLVIVALHFSGNVFMKAKGVALLVVMAVWYTLAHLTRAYFLGILLLQRRGEEAAVPGITPVILISYIWYPTLYILLIIHTVRTINWFFVRGARIFFRSRETGERYIMFISVLIVTCVYFVFVSVPMPLNLLAVYS